MNLAQSSAVQDKATGEFILQEINQLPETVKPGDLDMKAIHDLGRLFFSSNQFDISTGIARKGLKLADRYGHEGDQIIYRLLLAENMYQRLIPDSSRYYLETAERISGSDHPHKYQVPLLNAKGNLARAEGNNEDAIRLFMKAAELLQQSDNGHELAIVYDNIGMLHLSMGNHEQAKRYLLDAVKICEIHKMVPELNRVIINLGVIFKEQDSLDQSAVWYKRSIGISRNLRDDFQLARCFMNLANVYMLQRHFQEAERYFDSSLLLCIRDSIRIGIIFNKINLGELYIATNRAASAILTLREAENLLRQTPMPESEAELYRLLSLAYESTGQTTEAFRFFKMHAHIRDSLQNAESKRNILEYEERVKQERAAREIAQLNEEILMNRYRNRTMAIIFILLFFMVLSVAVYLYVRRRYAEQRSRSARAEAERLRADMDLKNRELTSNAMALSQVNEKVSAIGQKLRELQPGLDEEASAHLSRLITEIDRGVPTVSAMKELDQRFRQLHGDFHRSLLAMYPDLSPAEIRICSFLKLNMTSKDIAHLTHRSIRTVENTRNNIRAKMKLPPDTNLVNHLMKI